MNISLCFNVVITLTYVIWRSITHSGILQLAIKHLFLAAGGEVEFVKELKVSVNKHLRILSRISWIYIMDVYFRE